MKILVTEKITEVEGNKIEILSGIAKLINGLKDNDFSEEELRYVVELGFKSDEKLKKEALDKINKIKKVFGKFMDDDFLRKMFDE